MTRYPKIRAIITVIFICFGAGEIKAETGSMGYIGPASSNNTATTSTSNDAKSSSVPSAKSSTAKPAAALAGANTVSAAGVAATASSAGVSTNVQLTSVQVEPYSGSAGLSIPIAVPAGRAGIQPNLALTYSSSNRQLGNTGVGWNLDFGSIQISTKKGVPKYDGTDIITMEQEGATQDLVQDPNNSNLYHMETEGAFANIQYFSNYWVITDKKGIKYYYGNTSDSIQNDHANPSHIFRWALNRVEDLNGNYMTISYLQDNGQMYPQTISYTGNDQSSLNLSTYAQVSISYVAASSPSTSYVSKFLVKTAQRIDHITISVGPNIQSTYTFTYHQSAYTQRDLLQSVQQTGADGTSTLPPVTFTYTDTGSKGFLLDSSWNLSGLPAFSNLHNLSPNNWIWEDMGLREANLTGNGYPDFIEYSTPWGGSTTNQAYLNTTQKSWAATGNWRMTMSGIPNFPSQTVGFDTYTTNTNSIRYAGLAMLDVYGNGLSDIVQNYKQDQYYGGRYFQYSATNNGTSGFTADGWFLPPDALIDYELGEPTYGYTVSGATAFGSITGSGFPDVAVARTVWYPSNNVYLNNLGLGLTTEGWTLSSNYTTPSGVDFSQGAALVDLAGDGMADIINVSSGTVSVYENTGNGWVLNPSSPWAQNVPSSINLANGSTQFVDLLGDGLPDIVSSNNEGAGTVLINTGNGWMQDSAWALKGGVDFTNFGTQFLDANATGMPDYIVSTSSEGQTYQLGMYTNEAQPADLLIGVNNGIGASTSIQYDSDLHYQNTYMPFFIPVVKSTTTTVGAQSYTTTYSYAGGLWDTNYREFDGFSMVKVIDPNGNYVTTTYLQDHWLKGHPSEQDTYDSNGNLYSKSINQWQAQTIATNSASNQTSKFLYVSRTDNYLYDGNNSATPKRTAQEFTYAENPQYGDVTQTINDGQVDPVAGTSIDANRTTTQITYVNNTANWLIGLPTVVQTKDKNSNNVSMTVFYYDGYNTTTTAPVLGHLTTKVNWLGSSTQPDPKTTYTYDAYGNLQTTTDPNGNTTTITYDNTVHMFPVKTTNALTQTATMTYYGIDTAPLNSAGLQGLWGQDRSKTDANNQTAYTVYDAFGRPSASISPLDSVALPTEQKIYNIQPTYIAITDTARAVNGSSATISTVSYYDGLGRLIETKSMGPVAGQYIASGQTIYDNRGLPVTKYLPHFTSNDLNTMDAIDSTVPFSQAVYDPMGRVTVKTNPDGTYSSIAYNQWTSTTTDENGHMQGSTVDAFGRLVQKQEYSGSDGRSPNYSQAAYTLYATTTYNYNPQGNLTSVMDAHNNMTSITYDNLGRKIGMNDPDMGRWQYGYDSNGNLIWQQDAKGQVISFKYDALNRLTNKTDAISGPIVNLPNVPAQAPTFNVNYNFDDHVQSFGIGRLGSVAYDTGRAGFIYDSLGREASSNKTIGGMNYNVTRQYDALNRLQQLQYPDGSQVTYVYNQAGQVAGVADASAVLNGQIAGLSSGQLKNNDRLAWFDKALGINNAYAAGAPSPVVSITSPANAGSFTAGSTIAIAASASENGGTISRVAFYNGTTLLGTGTSSPYTYAWSNVPAGNYSLTAVATDANGVVVTSSLVTGTVAPSGEIIDNTDPSKVTITGAWTASTTDPGYYGTNYINDGNVLKGSKSVKYTPALAGGAGSYRVYIRYTPDSNRANNVPVDIIHSGTTTTVTVNQQANASTWVLLGTYNFLGNASGEGVTIRTTATNGYVIADAVEFTQVTSLPLVAITSPISGFFQEGSNVTITAAASEIGGIIKKVDFYNWTTLLGTVTTSPYTYTLNNLANDTIYQVTAVATDSNGVTSTSGPVYLFYYTGAPVVSISNPVNQSTFVAGCNISITAAASESYGGTISQVSFYNGTTLIGTATSSPYTYTWTNVTAGTYNLTAVATDGIGTTTTSSIVSVTVTPSSEIIDNTDPSKVAITGAWTASTTDPGYYGTNYIHDGNALKGTKSVKYTPALAGGAGSYQAYIRYTADSGRANNVPVDIIHSGTTTTVTVNQQANGGTWFLLGTYNFLGNASREGVTIRTTGTSGYVIADAVEFVQLTATEPPPTVSLTANSSTYAAPAIVTLTATASQSGGTISRVDFYNGPTLLGSSSANPYTYTWSNVPAGSYSLTAKAYNNTGVMTTSSAVNVGVIAPNVYIKSINYNANGQITQIQYGNGAVTAYTYDPLMFRLLRIYTSNAQSTVIQDLNYTYDSVGQVLKITDNVNTGTASMTQSFGYDALNRLVAATGAYGSKVYAYDSIGNITQKDGLTYTYTGAGPHAVTSLSDGSVFTYDADGNMASLQKGSNLTTYVYDSQNRLQTVKVGAMVVASYIYDGDGGRTEKTVYRRDLALYNDNVNAMLFGNVTNPLPATAQNPTVDTTIDVGNVYETESGSSRNTKFIYLGSTRVAAVGSDGTVMYYHTDHLGGTNVLTDQSGLVRELTEYDPFGQIITHEKFGNNTATAWYYFTGKPLDDETGLIFLGARYYNPSVGRFITPDTIVPNAGNPQSLNRYSYCDNNPVNFTDPSGHKKKSWWGRLWEKYGNWISPLGNAISTGKWNQFAITVISMATMFIPGVGTFANIYMNIAVHAAIGAAEGAVIGGVSSVIMGGSFGQGAVSGAIGGAIGGAIQGITTSEQFGNWRAGKGFESNVDVQRDLSKAIDWSQKPALNFNDANGKNGIGWDDTSDLITRGDGEADLFPMADKVGGGGSADIGYRYVGSSEANIASGGNIPNVDQFGQAKNVFYTTDVPLSSGIQAQGAYNLTSTPTYRLTFSTQGITNIYGGNVAGGTGTEFITRQGIAGNIKIDKLSQ